MAVDDIPRASYNLFSATILKMFEKDYLGKRMVGLCFRWAQNRSWSMETNGVDDLTRLCVIFRRIGVDGIWQSDQSAHRMH